MTPSCYIVSPSLAKSSATIPNTDASVGKFNTGYGIGYPAGNGTVSGGYNPDNGSYNAGYQGPCSC